MAVASPEIRTDQPVIGGYQLEVRLGAGGQGEVYLARSRDGDLVALKVLHPRLLADGKARERLAKEVAAVRQVADFCTARILEARLGQDPPFIVSEFIAGPSLARHVERRGPLRGAALDRVTIGTASALAAIHAAGVVHRDVKPQNVVLGPDGPRVVDFGIALAPGVETTTTSGVIGTPAYMAPERFESGRVGPEADMFAWGCVAAFAATGRSPFDAPSISAIMYRILAEPPELDGVPLRLRDLVLRCLAHDPARRPSAAEVLLELVGRPGEAPLADRPPEDRPAADRRSPRTRRRPGFSRRRPGFSRRRPGLSRPALVTGAGGVLAAAGLLVIGASTLGQPASAPLVSHSTSGHTSGAASGTTPPGIPGSGTTGDPGSSGPRSGHQRSGSSRTAEPSPRPSANRASHPGESGSGSGGGGAANPVSSVLNGIIGIIKHPGLPLQP